MPRNSAPNSPTISSMASPAADGRRPLAPRAPEDLGFREVLYAKRDGVARITLNRPGRYNAYSTAALEELAAAFRDATGTSRKYVMAILEDLDRRAILRRTPDGHVPGPKAPAPTSR